VEGKADSAPTPEEKKYSSHAFGAHFVEMRVDEALGTARVGRVVTTIAAGRILNAKTASKVGLDGLCTGPSSRPGVMRCHHAVGPSSC
jgi:xanthine dehydrogenase YagR molybdenum-binding subunit